MTEIIIRPGEHDNPRIILPNTDTPYDPNVAQDHTDQKFLASGKIPLPGDRRRMTDIFMRNPKFVECPGCGSTNRFRLIADDHPEGDAMVQFVCDKCKTLWPVLQMHIPNMNDAIANKLGLVIPEVIIGGDDDEDY